jgi:hypothetical protein
VLRSQETGNSELLTEGPSDVQPDDEGCLKLVVLEGDGMDA